MMMKTATALCACLLTAPAWGTYDPFDLVYDPSDGSLFMDTNGGRVINYVIQGGPFIEENHNSPLAFNNNPFVASVDFELAASNTAGPFLTEPWNLGQVLPAGLSESDFYSHITNTQYVEAFSTPLRSFDLVYGTQNNNNGGGTPAYGTTDVMIAVQGLFDANGQVLASSSKTMAIIDVDGDGLAGFDFENWDGSSFLPDPDDVIVSDPVKGQWYEATGDGDPIETWDPSVANSVLDSDEASPYTMDIGNIAANDDTTVGTGDRVYLFYFPGLDIDATEPGAFQAFGVVEVGSISEPGVLSKFNTIGPGIEFLANNDTGEGTVAQFATVPEPASMTLLGLAAGLMLVRRRRA